MITGTIIRNIRETKRILLEDLADFAWSKMRPLKTDLTEEQKDCLAALRRDGFAVMKNYWRREKALKVRDHLEAYLLAGRSRDYENGAYLRFWDEREYDQGVRRIYHVERLVEELKDFRYDEHILGIVGAYYGVPFYSGVLVYQHNTRSNGNTRYYHVDAFSREFKAMMYLDDVDEGNGPLVYLRGTHRSHFVRLRKQVLGNAIGSPTSFYGRDLKSVLGREVKVFGPAGTLILTDVRGFHRGSPQIGRSRSVLVNYILKQSGDVFLDK